MLARYRTSQTGYTGIGNKKAFVANVVLVLFATLLYSSSAHPGAYSFDHENSLKNLFRKKGPQNTSRWPIAATSIGDIQVQKMPRLVPRV